ncbi:MAG: periplasmic heavy metal sensor [Pseudomonadales bacterium]|nr:periplasmic heavy metal sensor [Pseudomonadales bacterium]
MNRSKLILVVLITSIAINLIFIGGISYRASAVREPSLRPFPPSVGWAVRDLSEERQAELEPLLEASNEEIRPMRQQMFQATRRVNELMRADEFNAEELRTAFEQLRSASNSYQALSHEQSIALLSELTEEERRTAQEFMQRRGPRGERDGRRGRSGPGFGPGGGPPPDGFGGRPPPQRDF